MRSIGRGTVIAVLKAGCLINVKAGAFSPITSWVLLKHEYWQDAPNRRGYGQKKKTAVQDAGKDMLASLQPAKPER